jgi:hypothetical protein
MKTRNAQSQCKIFKFNNQHEITNQKSEWGFDP